MPILVILGACGLGLAVGEESWRHALRYDRDAMSGGGDLWRWVTAHLVHASWSHTLMNIAGLVVVWLLFTQRLEGWAGLLIVLVSIALMDAGFWYRDTQLGWYVGMSGLLHALYTAGAWDETWRGKSGGVWLLVGVVAKLLYEQFFGALPMTEASSGGPVWVNAHLYGAVGGFFAATLLNSRTAFTPFNSRRDSSGESQ